MVTGNWLTHPVQQVSHQFSQHSDTNYWDSLNVWNCNNGPQGYLNQQRAFSLPRFSRGGKNKYYRINTLVSTNRAKLSKQTSVNHKNLIQVRADTSSFAKSLSTFCLINTQSVRNKIELVKDFILEHDIDICALTETWLSKFDELVVQQLQPDGYKLLHVDCMDRSGGRVAVLCRGSTHLVLSSEAKFTSFESINIKLKIHQTFTNLVVIYRPPSLPQVPASVFLNEFSRYLEEIITSPGKPLIVVDFNFHVDDLEKESAGPSPRPSLVVPKLDYGNALYYGLPVALIHKLQRVQNAAARLVCGIRKFDHITPILKSLHWLPVQQRIEYKVLLLCFKAIHGLAPDHLASLLTQHVPIRCL